MRKGIIVFYHEKYREYYPHFRLVLFYSVQSNISKNSNVKKNESNAYTFYTLTYAVKCEKLK